ncbi:phage portal protein [Lactococcus lactis]
MATNVLLSKDPTIIASGIKQAIQSDLKDKKKEIAQQGVDYYNYKHDILDNRIFYIDDNNNLKEDKYATNIKIPNAFLNELIDQKVQYLLSNPVEIECDDDKLAEYLEDYYNEDFQLFLNDLLTNGSQKGFEYVYPRTTPDDVIVFQVLDGLKIIPIYDDLNVVQKVLRYYSNDIVKDGKVETIKTAELYDDKEVMTFEAFEKDDYKYIGSQPHILGTNGEEIGGRSYNTIPLYRYQNNQQERTDLEPIKALIDDYDLMNSYLSNNLQSFSDAIYVVRGFEGDSLDKLQMNLRNKKVVGVGDDGGIDEKVVNIPVEGRKTKMEIDSENIYRFGFGFDSSQVGDGNVTNVVIKSRYTRLDMKANKTETRLRAFLKWSLDLVIADINRKNNTSFNSNQVEFVITREMLVNENDLADNKKVEADTKSVEVQTLLAAAPLLPDDEVVQMICDIYDLDYDEIQQQLSVKGYESKPEQ